MKSLKPSIKFKRTTLLFIPLALVCFALPLVPKTFGVTPPPEGGYPNNNTAEGSGALFSLTSGINNTALGTRALFTNDTGNYNTATGSLALERNRSGSLNTATGYDALFSNTTGHDNTATGFRALFSNTGATADNRLAGSDNTANGSGALSHNTTGNNNTAIGFQALFSNSGASASNVDAGSQNTAIGTGALFSNTTGIGNTAVGAGALQMGKGDLNTGIGEFALFAVNGRENIGIGTGAFDTASGQENIAIGDSASVSVQGNSNVAIGQDALISAGTASYNVALGAGAGQNLLTGDYNIYIGSDGPPPPASPDVPAPESDTIRVGESTIQTATFIAGIYGQSVDAASGVPVQIDSTGKLGTILSSARFKQAIKPMDKSSEALLALKPVTFQYKPELDPKGVPQFGLVAEQVEKVAPELVIHDKQGKPYTVRYEAVNAMLLNEFLKEHRKVEEQAATIAQMKQQMKTLAATVQKVSAQVQASQPTLVAGN